MCVRKRVVRSGIGNRFGRSIDGGQQMCGLGEVGRAITGAAAYVEYALTRGVARGEGVSGGVLRPQIIVDLAWDHTLACELDHSAGAPAAILEFTSTRHGKWNCP